MPGPFISHGLLHSDLLVYNKFNKINHFGSLEYHYAKIQGKLQNQLNKKKIDYDHVTDACNLKVYAFRTIYLVINVAILLLLSHWLIYWKKRSLQTEQV